MCVVVLTPSSGRCKQFRDQHVRGGPPDDDADEASIEGDGGVFSQVPRHQHALAMWLWRPLSKQVGGLFLSF